jgi:hypothetical protein
VEEFSLVEGSKFQAAWTPPAKMNLGQKIFVTIILFL